jgi:putative transposase
VSSHSTARKTSSSQLLRGVAIDGPDHVWSADITYIAMGKGFLYLTAVMD